MLRKIPINSNILVVFLDLKPHLVVVVLAAIRGIDGNSYAVEVVVKVP